MRRMWMAAVLAGTGMASAAGAQSPFDGTWMARPEAAQLDKKPVVYVLRGGAYRCASCTPAFTVPADGGFHPIAGHPYADAVAITVVNPSTVIERDRKAGKLISVDRMTISADGRTLTDQFEDHSAPNGKLVTGRQVSTRVSPPPAGAHAISGGWRSGPVSGMSEVGLRFVLATRGDVLRYEDPTGLKWQGRFGGPYTPVVGDPANSVAKVERLGPSSMRRTTMRSGKVVGISTISISADGRTLTNAYQDKVGGRTSRFIAVKQ